VAQRARARFADFDLLLTLATPCSAPAHGRGHHQIEGKQVPVRANLGMFCQPISFIGLPALAVPALADTPLPIGVQMIAPHGPKRSIHTAHHLHRAEPSAPAP
jgi:aspartyl-tRNA(Asn)/glutamyl-tRNA(Gln) amidotransferase subunit A